MHASTKKRGVEDANKEGQVENGKYRIEEFKSSYLVEVCENDIREPLVRDPGTLCSKYEKCRKC
jgi:hypothetical protein